MLVRLARIPIAALAPRAAQQVRTACLELVPLHRTPATGRGHAALPQHPRVLVLEPAAPEDALAGVQTRPFDLALDVAQRQLKLEGPLGVADRYHATRTGIVGDEVVRPDGGNVCEDRLRLVSRVVQHGLAFKECDRVVTARLPVNEGRLKLVQRLLDM